MVFFPSEFRDVYFEEEYVKLYEDKENQAVCFVYKKNNKILLFPFLRRKFNFKDKTYFDFETAYGYGGPISNIEDNSFKKEALEVFFNYCKNNHYVAGFIRFHPMLKNFISFDSIGKTILDRKTVLINLQKSTEELWLEVQSRNRSYIRKASKLGLRFIDDFDYKYLDDFMSLYKKTMDKLKSDKFYYFNSSYFRLIQNVKHSFLGIVTYESKVISAAIFLYSEDYGNYHLAGSSMDYLSMRPVNFMLWEATKTLKKRGVKFFHLGGGLNSDINNSLLGFKRKFSKDSCDFYIGKLIFNQEVYDDLCNTWEVKNPEKTEKYKFHLLKYKY